MIAGFADGVGGRGPRVAYRGGVDPRTRRIVTLLVLLGLVAAVVLSAIV